MARTRTRRFSATALLAVAGLALPALAQQPQGHTVAAGSAAFDQHGNYLGITASNGSIINWQSFNIGQGQTVQFFQPGSNSRVLNRVSGPDPSRIAGTLLSNGIVYITNAAGVFFAHGALVNVGGIYAAAGNISNADFAAGRNHFTGVQGAVQNDGVINSPAAHLVGQRVANYGTINAPNGMVTMTAGSDVFIGEQGGQIFARIEGAPANGGTGVTQAGDINAAGGQVRLGAGDMYAVAIDHPGRTTARNITLQGGHGSNDPNVNGGIVSVTGRLDASDSAAGHTGGTVKVLGDRVGVFGAGYIDASGDAGGGTILVGGNRQGQGPETNSRATYVGVDATLRADATGSGQGGEVIVYSDNLTRAYGHISARGIDFGGFVETSGKHELQIMRTPDIGATGGRHGTWLIDPDDLTFAAAGSGNTGIVTSGTTVFTSSGAGAMLDVGILEAALTGGATVEVRTGASGTPAGGTITLPTGIDIDYNGTGSNTLSLFAHRRIVLDGRILDSNTGTADLLNLNLTADVDANGTGNILIHNTVDTGGGDFTVLRAVNFDNTGGSISTHGGDISITLETTAGLSTLGADLDAGTGAVTVNSDAILGTDLHVTGGNITFARRIDSDSTARDLTLSLTGPGAARLFGRIGFTSALDNLSVSSAGNAGTTRLSGTSIRANGDATFSDDVELASDLSLSAANATFARTIDAFGAAHALNVTVGAGGLARFFGAIGNGTALSSFAVDSTNHTGTTRLGAGSVTTLGAQTYGQDVVLLRDTTMTGLGFTFSRKVDSDGTARDLTIGSGGHAAISFFGLVGSVSALDAFQTSGIGSTNLNSAGLTAATVDIGNSFLVGADTTVTGTTSVRFGGTVSGRAGPSHDLTINSPDTKFDGAVLANPGGSIRSLITDAAGTTTINTTDMAARYLDFGDRVVLGADAHLAAGGSVVFRSTLDSTATDAHDLRIFSPITNFNGRIGAQTAGSALGSLTVNGGTSTLNATQITADTVDFNSAVILATNTTIDAATSIRFGAELDSRSGLNRNLTLNSPLTTFSGVVGGSSGGALGVLTTDAPGTTHLDSGAITVGTAAFNDAVRVDSDCVLTGNLSVTFNSTLNSAPGEGNDLTINSPLTTFVGIVGTTDGDQLGALVTDAAGTTTINASMTADSLSFQDAVVLNADLILTGTASINFGSTINSASGQANDLTLNSLQTTIVGDIGAGTGGALGTLTTDAPGTTTIGATTGSTTTGAITAAAVVFNDSVTFGGGTITTTGDQNFNGALTLAHDTTLAGHNITFGISIDSSVSDQALVINAAGDTTFNGPIGSVIPLASILTDAPGRTLMNGGVINTSGDQTYNDPITLGITTVISGNDLNFNSTIDSDSLARALTVNSNQSGQTLFSMAVGGSHQLASLITNSDGSTRLNGGTVGAEGTIAFNDAVLLGADTTLAGGAVAFGSSLDSDTVQRVLVVNTLNNGVTSFNGSVGQSAPLASITTNADGSTQFFGAAIRTTGDQNYHDAVTLGADCVISAENTTFSSTIDSTALLSSAGLVVNSANSGTTTFAGVIGGSAPLKFLTTDAAGVTRIGANITTSGGTMTFNDTVRLTGSVVLTDTGGTGVSFGGTLDSEGSGRNLTILLNDSSNATLTSPTIAHISFSGNVGSAFALNSLTLGGDRAVSPAAATIFAGINAGTPVPSYALTITTTGDFTMGVGQKFSVLGDLTINAGGTARVGDISTLGNMSVNGPSIVIQTRPGGGNLTLVQGTSGSALTMSSDLGVDFVAGGMINFSTAPTVSGSFAAPSFATPGAVNISSTLSGFAQRDVGSVSAAQMHSGSTVLDLSGTGPTNTNVSEAIAGALPDEEQVGFVFRDTAAGKAQQEELAELGIATSSPDAKLMADILSGQAFYNDATARDPWSEGYRITINRLSARAVAEVLATYRSIFIKDGVQQASHVQEVLAAAWKEYSAAAGSKADALGFRAYCEAVPAQAEATYYLDGLRDLFSQLGYLGLSPAELRHAKATILKVVAVPGLSAAQLESAITATNMGVVAAR